MYPQWHTHEITLDEKNCVTSMKMNGAGGAEVEDVVKLTDTNATNIQSVMTVEFTLSNQDGSFCVTKIFDSIPKLIYSNGILVHLVHPSNIMHKL